mmetsp:Transcript_83045/g.173854  ORF Transcript_83045/g.173854 Transcript_83045/m.173854 type:complete len:300 (+) Transcript_83045:135-1034(+)
MTDAQTPQKRPSTEDSDGSPAKKPCSEGKTSKWKELLDERVQEAVKEHSRQEMLDAVFQRWDRDNSGEIDFEEILPHFVKATNHVAEDEKEVRQKFQTFLKSKGRDPTKGGLTYDLFCSWLGPATDEQVATQYVISVQGVTQEPFSMNVDLAVVKAYEGKSLKEILDAPTSAIQGLSEPMADILKELDVHTIRDLGTWKFFLIARALVVLSEKESHNKSQSSKGRMNIRHAVDRAHEAKNLQQVIQLHPSAFNMFSDKAGAVLEKLKIKTIQQLGTRKMFAWANAMVELEKYEDLAQLG